MILLCANPADGWAAKIDNQCNQSQHQNDAQPNNNHKTRVKPAFIDPLHLFCVCKLRAGAAIFRVLFARYFNIKIGVQIDAARTANRSDSVDRRVMGIPTKILRNRVQSQTCFVCNMLVRDVRGVDTSQIVRTSDFDKPVRQLKKGGYKMKPGLVYLGFSTDFLIEEADPWRADCWKMIRERQDCTFLFLTKRIERFSQCIPDDWADGYENVTVCCTIENQQSADRKLPVFCSLPVRHRCITAQPLLERVNLEPYLDGVELVVVGG